MPGKARVSEEDAINLVKAFAIHFTTEKLPKYSSEVWKKMSQQTNGAWSSLNVYINVREDRRRILSKARFALNICVIKENNDCIESYSSHSDEDTEKNDEDSWSPVDLNNPSTSSDELIELELVLTENEWDAFKPTERRGKKQRFYLKKKVWGNMFRLALWQQHKLPCALSLKRAEVTLINNGTTFKIKILGRCISKICGNKITASGEKQVSEKGLRLKVETREVRNAFHEQVTTNLNGERRLEVQQALEAKGCKIWQREQARLYMDHGDPVPPFIPKSPVLRNAKKEKINRDLDIRPDDGNDVVRTISNLSITSEFAGIITWTGMNPFFTFYFTPAGMHAYKDYCRIEKGGATISLDATGSLVKKIVLIDGVLSGHIFLYSIVINFENTTLPVYHMLSEAHGVDIIEFWLMHWVRAGAPKPKVTVCDYSRALLVSLCKVYNNCTPKEYVEWVFSIAINNGTLVRPGIPGTIHRVDVAHVTHMVVRWSCFKSVRQRCIKEFYLRCVALMVDSTSVEEFGEIFVLTCAVGLQDYEDSVMNLPGAKSTREARERLEDRIADHKSNIDIDTIDKVSDKDEFADGKKGGYGPLESEPDPIESAESSTLLVWLTNQKNKAETTLTEGKNLNPFYLPDFVQQLFDLAKEFPLWTSAAIPPSIPRPIPHASSSYAEGYFSDIKTRVLKNTPPPLRVDKFIKIHIRDISGQALLFSSNIIAFNQKIRTLKKMEVKIDDKEKRTIKKEEPLQKPRCLDQNVSNRSKADLMSREDWRGKASHGRKYILDATDDSLLEFCEPIMSSSRFEGDNRTLLIDGSTDAALNVLSNISLDHDYCQSNLVTMPERKELEDDQSQLIETAQQLITSPLSVLHEPVAGAEPMLDLCPPLPAEIPNNLVSVKHKLRKKKPSKYYNPCPDIRQRNILTSNTSKAVLLPNGSICDKPVKVNGNKIFVKSTCSFDSLVHILMTSALDNLEYSSILKQSSNETLQFVWALINSGVTKEILQQRAELLKHLEYPCLPGPNTENRIFSYSLNAWDSIANMVVKALDSCPSVCITEKCTGCEGLSHVQHYLTPNHKKIEMNGFEALEDALNFQLVQHGILCRRCGSESTAHMKLNIHVLIDLDIRSSTELGVAKTGLKCKLTQLPSSITFRVSEELRSTYRLIGVTTYNAAHFVAHCRRSIGIWQLYNDMNFKIVKSVLSKDVEPHLAVYLCEKHL